MLYNCIKIIHILSAALLLTSIAYSIFSWHRIRYANQDIVVSERIQTQTWVFIVPFAVFQLATGFTMISLQHYDFSELWIKGSVIGFVVVILSWFGFIYFLLSGQNSPSVFFRRLQSSMLVLCTFSLLCMIFFMANKVVG